MARHLGETHNKGPPHPSEVLHVYKHVDVKPCHWRQVANSNSISAVSAADAPCTGYVPASQHPDWTKRRSQQAVGAVHPSTRLAWIDPVQHSACMLPTQARLPDTVPGGMETASSPPRQPAVCASAGGYGSSCGGSVPECDEHVRCYAELNPAMASSTELPEPIAQPSATVNEDATVDQTDSYLTEDDRARYLGGRTRSSEPQAPALEAAAAAAADPERGGHLAGDMFKRLMTEQQSRSLARAGMWRSAQSEMQTVGGADGMAAASSLLLHDDDHAIEDAMSKYR